MEHKLLDSEYKVLSVLWREGTLPANRVAEILAGETGWSRNTTYTILKRCVDKGLIRRTEPRFQCTALVDRQQVGQAETDSLIDRYYDGSADKLFSALLGRKKLTKTQLDALEAILGELEGVEEP